MNNNLSLTKRLIYLILILLIIPLLINLISITCLSFSSTKQNINYSLKTEANNYLLAFQEIIKLNNLQLRQLENILLIKESDVDLEQWLMSTFRNILEKQSFDYYLVDTNNIIISAQENIVHKFLISNSNFLNHTLLTKENTSFIFVLKDFISNENLSFLLTIKKILINKKIYYLIKSENILNIWNWIHKFKINNKNINVILTSNTGEILASSNKISSKNFPFLINKESSSQKIQYFSFNNKKYLSYVLKNKQIEGLSIITFYPFKNFIWKILKLPIKIFAFFFVTFSIGTVIIWIMANKISQPLYNLYLCMLDVKKGNYRARFIPSTHESEFNYLGEKFNHTLNLLLSFIEKTEKEKIERKKLEHELLLIKEIQKKILFPLSLQVPYISKKIIHIPGILIKGVFQEWQELSFSSNNKILRYGIGIAEDIGLTSCLYSITMRSIFLAYSKTLTKLENVITSTQRDFFQNLPRASTSLNMFAFDYDYIKKEISYFLIGQNLTIIKKQKNNISMISSTRNCHKTLIKETFPISSGEELLIITDSNPNNSSNEISLEQLLLNLINKDRDKTLDSLVSEIKEIYILNKKNSQEVIITILNFK